MDYRNRISKLIRALVESAHKRKGIILVLSCLVVFVSTYVLILPAFTLTPNEAASQGGIDVPAKLLSVETEDKETADQAPADKESAGDETGSGKDAEVAGKSDNAGEKDAKDTGKGTDASESSESKTATEADADKSDTSVDSSDAKEDSGADASGDKALSDKSDEDADQEEDQADADQKDSKIKNTVIDAKGDTWEITVTYGDYAEIPDDAKLMAKEFDATSDEYLAAWDSVAKKAKENAPEQDSVKDNTSENAKKTGSGSFTLAVTDTAEDSETQNAESKSTESKKDEPIVIAENVVPDIFGMAAFDISITDADGNPVEPEAPVDVSIHLKELPEDVDSDVLESSLAVQHLNESTGEPVVETVASVSDDLPGEIEIKKDSITADFTVDSFSTYTITWGGGMAGKQITNISSGDYIIYAQDASDGNYYALVPSTNTNTNLKSVKLDYSNGVLSYSGNENLYWHVTTGNTYQIYYSSGYRNYYLYPTTGTLNNGNTSSLRVRTSSYSWNQWSNHLYSGGDTFMRSNNGTFQVWNVSYDGNWQSKTNIYFANSNASSETVTVHYGYMENGVFHEFDELPEGAESSYDGPSVVGDQLDLRYDVDGYEYVTSRLTSPDGTDISNLLNTDGSSANAWKYRELTDENEYHTWGEGDKAYDYNADTQLKDDVYVIYRKAVRTQGQEDPSGEEPLDIDAPIIDKEKQDNGDGTYDIDLSITGESASNKKSGRANVVVVLDTSNSMKEIVDGQTKWELATNALKTLSTELLGLNSSTDDSDKVEFAFVNFSNYVKNEKWIYSMGSDNKNHHLYNNAQTFNNMIDGLDREVYGGGTCWDKAMAAASSVLWNDNDPVYVVFVSDGDTISRAYANGRYDYWDGGTYCQDYSTEYNDTSKIVKENVDATTNFADKIKASGGTVYTIGINGGGALENLYRLNQGKVGYVEDPVAEKLHFDATNTQGLTDAFESIKNDIMSTLGYQNVVVTDGLTGMTQTALVSGNAGNFSYTVAKYHEEKEKLAELPAGASLRSTKDDEGNITAYSRNTGSDKETYPYIKTVKTVVSGSKAEVTKNGDGTVTIEFPDGTSDTVDQATYNEANKTVTWNFGEDYQLRDGYTYTVSFTVWPNQASYDLLAALRNGLLEWGDDYTYTDENGDQKTITFADYSEQIDKAGDDYALRSNVKSGNTVSYYKVATETLTSLPDGASIGTTTDPQTGVVTTYTRNNNGTYTRTVKTPGTLDFVNPEPMPLAGTKLAMTKVWNDTLDRGHLDKLIADAEAEGKTYSVTLVVSQNGKEYKRYTFKPVRKYYNDEAMTSEAPEGATTDYYKYIWPSQDVSIAPALLVSDPPEGWEDKGYKTVTLNNTVYYVLNEGHRYSIDETETDYHFEFTADPYYPSLIDSSSELTNVEFETNDDGSIKNGSEAVISGDGTLKSFEAHNSLTSELDITKKISDPKNLLTDAQEDAETFTYKVTLTLPKDADTSNIYAYEFVPRTDPWNGSTRVYAYGYQNDDADSVKGLDDDVARFNHQVFGRYTVSKPGDPRTLVDEFTNDSNGTTKSGTIFITLKRNEIIRFTNLPLGTTYSIQEIYANLRQADPSRDEDSIPSANTEPSNIEQQGYSVSVVTKNGDPDISETATANDTVSGTISKLDTRYYNQFTNTLNDAVAVNLAVKKHLEGYQWSGERYYVKLTDGDIIKRFTDTQRYLTRASGSEDVTYTYASPLRFAEEGEYSFTFTEYDSSYSNVLSGTNTGGIQYGQPVTVKVKVEKVGGRLQITNVEGGTLSDDKSLITATVVNRKGTELQLLKLGDGNFSIPLEGVQFKLYTNQDCADEHQVVKDSTGAAIGTNGLITTSSADSDKGMAYLGSLATGTYYLKEVSGHDGYNLLNELITITVGSDGTVSYSQSSFAGSGKGPDLVYTDKDGKYYYYSKIRNDESDTYKDDDAYTFSGYRIVVSNVSGTELPHTGGPGTTLIYLLGSLLIVLAGTGLVLHNRKKHA